MRFPDATESAQFGSRQEAVEHAPALIGDYKDTVEVIPVEPLGTLQEISQAVRFS